MLGDPIARSMGVGTFGGERRFFVIFLVVPALALVGAVVGAIAALSLRDRHAARDGAAGLRLAHAAEAALVSCPP